jgi:hypothetical protein
LDVALFVVHKLKLGSLRTVKDFADNFFHYFAVIDWDLQFKCSASFWNWNRRVIWMGNASSDRCKRNSELGKLGHFDV